MSIVEQLEQQAATQLERIGAAHHALKEEVKGLTTERDAALAALQAAQERLASVEALEAQLADLQQMRREDLAKLDHILQTLSPLIEG